MTGNSVEKPAVRPRFEEFLTAFASVTAVAVQSLKPLRGGPYVSWQSPNPRGRKGTAQGAGRVQARGGRKIRQSVLHHQLRREECLGLSLRGVAADRGEAGRPLHLQSHQEEVPEPHELLRAGG